MTTVRSVELQEHKVPAAHTQTSMSAPENILMQKMAPWVSLKHSHTHGEGDISVCLITSPACWRPILVLNNVVEYFAPVETEYWESCGPFQRFL